MTSNIFQRLYILAQKDPDEALRTISSLKAELHENLVNEKAQLKLFDQRKEKLKTDLAKIGDQAPVDNLDHNKAELERIHRQSLALKEKLEDIEGYITRNRLLLKSQKHLAELEAFIDPDNPENLAISDIHTTHREMLDKLQYDNALSEARLEMALEKLGAADEAQPATTGGGAAETEGSPAGSESGSTRPVETAEDRARRMVAEMKQQMGLGEE